MNTKIAIASDDGISISSHFGRTKGFVIFEIVDKEIKGREYRLNTFTRHAKGIMDFKGDPHSVIISALSDCKVVISHGMGRRIYEDLKRAGIEVYITDETDVEHALELYLKGELVNRPERSCEPDKKSG